LVLPWSRRGLLQEINNWQRVVALALLVFEAILLAFIYKSGNADWYVVLIAVAPLLLLICCYSLYMVCSLAIEVPAELIPTRCETLRF
jgi:hypothetical protein